MQNNRDSISLIADDTNLTRQKFRTRIHPELFFGAIVAVTILATFSISVAGYALGIEIVSPDSADFALPISLTITTIYTIFFFSIGKQSATLEDSSAIVRRSLIAWLISFMVLFWTVFLLKESSVYSRAAIICCFVIGLGVLPIVHLGIAKLTSRSIERGQIWFQQVALIGLTDMDELLKIESDLARRGIFVAQRSLISLAPIDRSHYLSRCREVTVEIQTTLQQVRLDGIWIVAPLNEQRRFDELWAALTQIPLPVVLFPNKAVQKTLHYSQVKAADYYGYEVQRAPLNRSERAIKRLMDLILASCALVVLSPIFIFTSIAILIESGRPVFFKQDRKGFGGRPFKILKFRSMRVQENGPEIKQAESSDPRITPLGAILRRTSIDELPQLINVLRGEMSIVGPRPHAIAHDNFYDRIIATYAFRHHVKPGITGWAQVNGFRGNTAKLSLMEGRVELDIWYINHWSPWLDIRIMVKTALEVLWHDAAY